MARQATGSSDFSIVVIDGQTAVQGGLDWDGLSSCGTVTVYPLTDEFELLRRLHGADAVITNKVAFRGTQFQQLPQLKYIGVTATGYNIIDLESARRCGIAVTNVPAYSTDSVAQHVFALMLSYYSQISHYAELSRSGEWSHSPQFCLIDRPTVELRGKSIGIIGFGSIGRQVAKIAEAFGMRILVLARPGNEQEGRVSLEDLLTHSDVVTLHCPLSEETAGMVNADFLSRMKSEALLINTSRGGLVVEADLAEALKRRVIAHAGLDVLDREPPAADNCLIHDPATTITPHIAWATLEARRRLVWEAVANLEAFRQGVRRNRVD